MPYFSTILHTEWSLTCFKHELLTSLMNNIHHTNIHQTSVFFLCPAVTPHNLAEFTADYLNSDEGRQGLVNQGIDKLKALQAAASAEYNQATIAVKAAGHAIVVYKEHVKANKELICESVEQNMAKIAGSLKGDMPEFRDLLKRFTRHVAQKV